MATGYPRVPVALLLNLKGGNPFGILQPAVELAQCGFTAVASIDSLMRCPKSGFGCGPSRQEKMTGAIDE